MMAGATGDKSGHIPTREHAPECKAFLNITWWILGFMLDIELGQNLVPLVNIKIAGKGCSIP